jgi:serine/threonine protein kinase
VLVLYHRCPPFADDNNNNIFEKILHEKVEVPKYVPPEAHDLIGKLLVLEPKDRLGHKDDATPIKKHPWFVGVDWQAVASRGAPGLLNPDVKSPNDTHNFCKYSDSDLSEDPADDADYSEAFEGF